MDVVVRPEMLGDETEGELTEWHVQNGDSVETGQVIAQIETAKVLLDIESPGSGTISLLIDEGTVFAPNAVIARIG